MDQRGQAILDRVLAKGGLPSLSPIALRLVELASDESVTAEDLARLIGQDPGLTARLLRLANSVAYRRAGGEVTSLSRAVVLMGLREVRIMALSISLRDTLPVKGRGLDYRPFWRASLYRALLAREVALRLALPQVEEAFVAGLLLEMGLPLLLRVLTAEELEDFPGLGASLRALLTWEQRRLGLNHREVGARVMAEWGLPAVLAACQGVLSEKSREKAPLLKEVADFARQAAETFFLPEKLLTDIHQTAWRLFGLDAEAVNQLMTSALLAAGEAAQALEVELDQEADLLFIMEKANQALVQLSSRLEDGVRAAAPAPAAGGAGLDSGQLQRLQDEAVAHTLDAVAHEIRNPLMSVGGFARRLARQGASSEKVMHYAQAILAEAARLDQALAQINSLLAPYQPKPQRLELAGLLRRLAGGGLPVRLVLPEKPVELTADGNGLQAALEHLLSYAAHLVDPDRRGEPLRLALRDRPDWVELACLGPGHPPAGGADAMAQRSFGPELALAQARRIALAHGGEVTVGAGPAGDGFALVLRLPRA
ncbi:MAG: HDOD domain-containing protein [Thermodesulfobacteriota bacterium]